MKRNQIILVDDHGFIRDGLRSLIQKQPDMEVAGDAADFRQAIELAKASNPDIAIVDIEMPGQNGIETARQIMASCPGCRVIILSGYADSARIHDALGVGVRGYVSKVNAAEEMVRAIRAVMAGKSFLCPEAASELLNSTGPAGDSASHPDLSERELNLLRLISAGKRNKEIALVFKVTTKAVEALRSRLMTKLGCPSTAELVRFAIRERIAAA